MKPNELENVMIAKQAAQSLMNQWEAVQEYLILMAKSKREFYLACLKEGFTTQEALQLAASFVLPGSNGTAG